MIPVIDLFAGPGGLGEGFSSLVDNEGNQVFHTILSIERDAQAHKTLRLRAYVRKLYQAEGCFPQAYLNYMQKHDSESLSQLVAYRTDLWEDASKEALCAELKDGDSRLVEEGRTRLEHYLTGSNKRWVLIGGPPCQAYSLVGRARRAHDDKLEDDPKQTLYKCYLSFIRELEPTIFVMENVKGLLSATRKGEGVFERICSDMKNEGYEIRSLVSEDPQYPIDYIVKSERFGIPQTRHRVILLGVKKDSGLETGTLIQKSEITLREALAGIPRIRSDFSKKTPERKHMSWQEYVIATIDELLNSEEGAPLAQVLHDNQEIELPRNCSENAILNERNRYLGWYRGRLSSSTILSNHESRTHLAADLKRYLFCAAYAATYGASAKIQDFPLSLYPNHKNVLNLTKSEQIKFNDRFRAQLWDKPSTTITSHIAKDGHYYIHPDPRQCRSLTVREAARLQTFPDDYLFEGTRTSQYTQVGNAVPPLLAQQIAKIVASALGVDSFGYCDCLTHPISSDSSSAYMDSLPF